MTVAVAADNEARKVPFPDVLYLECEDFMEEPPRKPRRLRSRTSAL